MDALYKLIEKKPKYVKNKNPKVNYSNCNFRLINIGNNKKTKLIDFFKILEKNLKINAKIKYDKI